MADETDKNTAGNPALKAYFERIERLMAEKAEADALINDIYAEARGNGFNVAIMKKAIARRAKDTAALQEEDALLELYEGAAK